MGRILVVEDDPLIADGLARALRARGHDVAVAHSIAAAHEQLDCELLLCDLGLPDGDGLDLIHAAIERDPSVAVIAVTARTDESDVIAGLLSGAVDYVKKPFSLIEILARVDAQIRLRDALAGTRAPETHSLGDLRIDHESRRVMLGALVVDLRRKEFDLLSKLAANVGKVVRREDLIEDVWGDNWWGSTKTLDVHINSLRRKLGESPGKPSRIRAIRGVGYRLEPG